jgi:hypothetical protein
VRADQVSAEARVLKGQAGTRRESVYNSVKDRNKKREQRERARAKGLCGVCCFRKPVPPYASCTVCLARGRDRNRLIGELMRAYRQESAA